MVAAAQGLTLPALGKINRAGRDTTMWRLLPFGLVAILVVGILVSYFLACRLSHISKGRLTGEDLEEKCLKGSKVFAMMDEATTERLRHRLSQGGART
jgi:hypothetical protein